MRPFLTAVAAAVVSATFLGGVVAPSALAAPEAATDAGGYVAVDQTRVWNAVTVGPHVTKTVQVAGGSTGVPDTGVGAVAATFSVLKSSGTGSLVAYAAGASRPGTANVQFRPGSRVADLALVVPGTNGSAAVYNNSAGYISVTVDLSGYYVRGASSAVKSYHPVKATRVADVTIGANKQANPVLGGRGPLPGFGIGAVAVTFTERTAARSGYLGAKAYHLPIAGTKVLHWTAGARASAFAIVPVDGDGRLTLTNYSAGSAEIAVDVVGFYYQGAPHEAGMLNTVPTARLLDPVLVAKNGTRTLTVHGRGGVALDSAEVRAVVLTVTVTSARAGSVLVHPGGPRPNAATVQFAAHQTTSNTAIVPLSASGTVSIYNHTPDATSVAVDVTAWVLDRSNEVPPTQAGRYVRNLSRTNETANRNKMRAEGAEDADSEFVLLDIGAQANDRSGVVLSATSVKIPYGMLRKALLAYVGAYVTAGGTGRIALGTSNSADDWTHYSASQRGSDWAVKVVNPVAAQDGAATVVGASDIEPAFGTGRVRDALQWKSAFLAATGADFVFNGSADACPVDFHRPGATCLNGWTEQQLYDLAGGSRTTALPQIYNSRQAIQWTNIDQTGGGNLVFAGALTENPVDGTYPADQGWAALYNGLATLTTSPSVPLVVELHVDA